jgi:hypothetical protein
MVTTGCDFPHGLGKPFEMKLITQIADVDLQN